MEQEPLFLTREQIDTIHRDQLEAWGGLHGLRNENGLESAIAQPQHVYVYGDGNKRTAVQAALDFLEIKGVDTSPLPELATFEAMIRVASHELDRSGLAAFFREILKPKI